MSSISSDSEYDLYTDYDLYIGEGDLEDKTPDPKHIREAAILCAYFLMTHMQHLSTQRLFSKGSKLDSVSSKCLSVFNALHSKNSSSQSTNESDIEYTEEEFLDLYVDCDELQPDNQEDKSDAKSSHVHPNDSSSQNNTEQNQEVCQAPDIQYTPEELLDLYDCAGLSMPQEFTEKVPNDWKSGKLETHDSQDVYLPNNLSDIVKRFA